MGAPGQVTLGSAPYSRPTPKPQFLSTIWDGRMGWEARVTEPLTRHSPQVVVGPPGAKGEKVSIKRKGGRNGSEGKPLTSSIIREPQETLLEPCWVSR